LKVIEAGPTGDGYDVRIEHGDGEHEVLHFLAPPKDAEEAAIACLAARSEVQEKRGREGEPPAGLCPVCGARSTVSKPAGVFADGDVVQPEKR